MRWRSASIARFVTRFNAPRASLDHQSPLRQAELKAQPALRCLSSSSSVLFSSLYVPFICNGKLDNYCHRLECIVSAVSSLRSSAANCNRTPGFHSSLINNCCTEHRASGLGPHTQPGSSGESNWLHARIHAARTHQASRPHGGTHASLLGKLPR